jgi:hypothetical protein
MTHKGAKTASTESKIIRSKTEMEAIGSWLFRGSQVYLLDQPHRMLTTKRINWDEQTTDVQDADGHVFYDIPWDDLEFWNPDDYHFPDDE